MADLTQTEWQEQLENDSDAVIIDVRTLAEIQQGFIPKAIYIDIYKGQEFINEVMKLDKNKSYYVYCRSGGRSGQACAFMKQAGFEKAFNLMGGFTQWQGEITYN
ncbi:MAG: rhodanese-like domain-containing protein [Bacteroidetes bacterium]|nr:MAG: rhodanese-like domain-containing protein [Bacteroidota bacterium]